MATPKKPTKAAQPRGEYGQFASAPQPRKKREPVPDTADSREGWWADAVPEHKEASFPLAAPRLVTVADTLKGCLEWITVIEESVARLDRTNQPDPVPSPADESLLDRIERHANQINDRLFALADRVSKIM